MTRRTISKGAISTGARLAVLALTTTAGLALAACEEHPYPSAASREATAAPPPDDSTLAGAPSGGGYAPTTRSPAYAPSQGYPPGPGMAQSGPPPSYGPPPMGYGPPQPGYPPASGQGYGGQGYALVGKATMDPIPNPPERPHRYERGYGWRHRHYHRHEMQGYGPPVYGPLRRHHLHHHHMIYAPAVHAPMTHRHSAATPMRAHPAAPAKAAPVAPAGAQLTKPQALDHHRHHRHTASAATAASGGASNTTGGADTTGSASEADRYQALQQSLHDAFANGAQLTVPAHMEPNQASTVTLTVPADFAQTVRNEAARQGLSAQAATVSLMASLSGDGYTIVPGEAQTQPLTLNTPTAFSWKVTPTGAGRGALKASARAAVGEGHDLTLGDKTTGSGGTTGRVVGIGLLALIALVLLGWAAQRRRPKMTGASRPRSTHTNGSI